MRCVLPPMFTDFLCVVSQIVTAVGLYCKTAIGFSYWQRRQRSRVIMMHYDVSAYIKPLQPASSALHAIATGIYRSRV